MLKALVGPLGQPVNVVPILRRATFRTLLTTLFDLPELLEQDADVRLCAMFTQVLEASAAPFYLVFGFLDREWFPYRKRHFELARQVNAMLTHAIQSKYEALLANPHTEQADVLTLMLQANQDPDNPTLTDDELLSNCKTLLLAGHETTTTSMCAIMHLLAAHPDIQDKVREEVRSVVGNVLTVPSLQQQKQLVYLNAVVREAQRMYPPAAQTIARRATQDITFPDSTAIPADASVAVNIWAMCYDPSIWPDPHTFLPERHLGDDRQGKTPSEFMVFSAGKRICPGMNLATLEQRIFLALLTQSYSWTFTDPPPQTFSIKYPFYLLIPDDLHLIFNPC
jgi:cytochrome P450